MIYISSTVSSQRNIKKAVLELVSCGFLNIELGGRFDFYEGLEEDLFDLRERYGCNFLVHGYFPPPPERFVMNIASNNSMLRDKTFRTIRRGIEVCKKLGNGLYTLHPGYSVSSVAEINGRFRQEAGPDTKGEKVNTKEDFYKAMDLLKSYSTEYKIKIGVENLFPLTKTLHSFLDSAGDILDFLNFCLCLPNIGLLLDLGHLNVAAKRLGFDKFDVIEKIFTNFLDKLFEVHLSENDSSFDSHEVSDWSSWQIELIRERIGVLRGIPIVFEWRNLGGEAAYAHFRRLEKIITEDGLCQIKSKS